MSLPSNISDHELLHPIGKGSYGEVWLARSVLGTLRAIKIVQRTKLSGARPFEREYLGIQRFEPISRSHEGLVDVLQVGRNEAEGFFYYVMELADPVSSNQPEQYVPRTLATDLASLHRLAPGDCVRLFHGLALALAHLHRAGLVHRDIKPSNIVFVNGVAKFADIGLVALADDSLSYVGTEGYIAPEGAGTVASDLYSFGKVLYECGTGRDRTDFPVLPPELAELKSEDGILELNAVWLKACATAAKDRYATADELAADLALLQAGRSVKRLRLAETRLRRARQFGRVAAGVALIALGGVLFSRHQADRERERGEQERRLRVRAEEAEQAGAKELSKSRVAQARAILQSLQIGRSATALALLTNHPSPDLIVEARSLAASALVLPDLVPVDGDLPSASPPPMIQPQADGSIRVVRSGINSSLPPAIIPNQGEKVRDPLILSDDRRFLYAGYGEYTERIWDLEYGRKVAQLDTNYYALAFRPGKAEAAVVYASGDLAIHRLPGWEIDSLWTNRAGEGPIEWSATGENLLFRTPGGGVGVFNAVSRQFPALGDLHAFIQTTAWHPDGKKFAVASDDGCVRIRDLDLWTDYTVLARHEAQTVRALFLAPFPWILTSSWDGTSRLWDWHAGHELGRIEATGYDIEYNEETRELAWRLGDESGRHRWRLNGWQFLKQMAFGNPRTVGGPFMASLSADNRWLATPDTDAVSVWNVSSPAEALRIPGYSQAVWINPDGSELIAILNGAVRHWKLLEPSGGKLRAVQLPPYGTALAGQKLAVSRDAKVVALLTDQTVELWDHGNHRSVAHNQELAETIAVSPDGRSLAVGTRNHVGARVFNIATQELLWKTGAGYGSHPAFSWDSRWLAVGTDHGCRVFDAATGAVRWEHRSPGGKDPTHWEVAFSPDGTMLAWTPKAFRVQLVDASTGGEILTLDYPTQRYITGLQFSADGRWLAETSNKHSLHLWDIGALRRELDALGLGWQ